MHALVVGGTGILRPLAAALAERGWTVTVVAREASDEGPGRFVVPVDVRKQGLLARALDAAIAERGPFELSVVYAPFARPGAMRKVATRSPGRLLYALTSEWAAPDADRHEMHVCAPDGAGSTQRAILGWVREGGETRWHTPEEISFGLIAALDGGEAEITLGELRPWDQQPA